MSSLQVDHAIIVVSDLDAAIERYRQLRFTVTVGGQHAGGLSHNALIPFEDGTYLELYALTGQDMLTRLRAGRTDGTLGPLLDGYDAINRRFFQGVACGDGLADLCLVTDALDATVGALRAEGQPVADPVANGRVRPDGQALRWRLAITQKPLPFLIEDETPRHLRVPSGDHSFHENGARGIERVTIAVAELAQAAAAFTAMLGADPLIDASPVAGAAHTADFRLGTCTITLATPAGDDGSLAGHLAQWGESPYALEIATGFLTEAGPLHIDETNGARIELVAAGHS